MSRRDKQVRFETFIDEEDYFILEDFCDDMYLTKKEYFEQRMMEILKENNIDIGVDDVQELYI